MADFDESVSQIACFASLGLPVRVQRMEDRKVALTGGTIVKHRWYRIVGTALFVGTLFPTLLISQTTQYTQAPGPYARIAVMRALDGHSVDWEAGYVRHLEWHRQAIDYFWKYTYNGYDFSIFGSTPITFPIAWHNSKLDGVSVRA